MKTLGIPKGTMEKPTLELLGKIGIRVLVDGRKFKVKLEGSDIFDQAIVMRPQDMPEALVDGLVDAAIYGFDCHEESGLGDQLAVVTELEYAKKTARPVSVVLFGKHRKLVDEFNILVTTEYPNLTKKIFQRATVRFSHGGTEQKVAYGKYDYGVCVTETGDSLRENGLVILKNILVSPTILAAKNETAELKYFGELLAGALKAEKYRLIKMNVAEKSLADVLKLLPSLESPTVNRLAHGGYAIETIVSATQIGNLIIDLQGFEVNGILVQEIVLMCR